MRHASRRRARLGTALALLALLAAAGCRGPVAPAPADALAEADALAVGGDLASALARLERALERNPDAADLWVRVGELERERGATAEAYAAFRTAARLAPRDVAAVSGLALAADALGFEAEAAAAYARWAELEGATADPAPAGPSRAP